jgi:hypothetical protein
MQKIFQNAKVNTHFSIGAKKRNKTQVKEDKKDRLYDSKIEINAKILYY